VDAARGSRKQARALHAANPTARLVLTGCWATLEPEAAAALPGIALVADNARKDLLPALLEPWSADFDDPAGLARSLPDGVPLFDAPPSGAATRVSRTRAFVKVQDGCNNRCTFCIVTVARGPSRSRPLRDVVAEVQRAVGEGVQEAVLTGVHLGSYGRDLAGGERSGLKELAAALLRETAIARLRLSSLEPWELASGFFGLWAEWPGRLCPHLHLPLQAGTDRQLRAMARRCTVGSFRALVEAARAAIPGLTVTTDLIAGFPGETEDDFARTCDFVAEMRFAHAHIFPFSARPGTAAATMPAQFPVPVRKERAARLRRIVEQIGAAERSRFLGTTRPVLWEGAGSPLTDDPGLLWAGHTDNYLPVRAVAPLGLDLHNRITPARLDAVQGDTLFATLIAA
jgi:threonylcarbamoyladenosine tRNA methylthiotransferase MtaB